MMLRGKYGHAGCMRTQQAIAAYEKQMRARASETARDILEATEVLHSMEAIPYLERIIS